MAMQPSRNMLESLLHELADWLEFDDCEPVEWVVCGGVALAFQGLRLRTTRDVDVLGDWKAADMVIACIEDFPSKVKTCIQRVTENHPELWGLGTNWINLVPRRLAAHGLPKGFAQRMASVQFGKRLTIHLLGRSDLLALKLYAAADDLGPRQEIHYQDIKAMNPKFDELDEAVDWVRTLPDFEEKRMELKEVVRRLDYDDLAYYI